MKKILVCRPTYFDVSYEINPWMKNQIGVVDKERATEQWTQFVDKLSTKVGVVVMPGWPGLPDMVFTANAGMVFDDSFLVSKFANLERQPESHHFRQWAVSTNKYNYVADANVNFEGEGDCLPDDKDNLWLGHGFRSKPTVKSDLTQWSGRNVHTVRLIDPRWYHLDTAFCPLGNDTVMWYPGAFDELGRELINSQFKNHVILTVADALAFAANCVVIGQDLFMPLCSAELVAELTALGYTVHTFDLSEFLKAGGAAKCLTLYLN